MSEKFDTKSSSKSPLSPTLGNKSTIEQSEDLNA
jgi:hypothetical protein